MVRRRVLLLVIVVLATLWNAPAANARLVAKTSMLTNSRAATTIVLKLSSTTPVTDRTRPTGVSVIGGGDTYALTKTGGRTTNTKLGTWKSKGYTGAARGELLALDGKQVTVRVRSRSGTMEFRSRLNGKDITGQAAIDQMTEVLNGGGLGDYSSSGTERYELHLCTDGVARYFHSFNSEFGSVTSEKFGQPWAVDDAFINSKGTYAAALVGVTFTVQNDFDSGGSQINEPWQTVVEYSEGTWYWAGEVAETLQASCDPTF